MLQVQPEADIPAVLEFGPAVASALTAVVLRAHGLRDPQAAHMLLTLSGKQLWQRAVQAHAKKPDIFATLPEGLHRTLTEQERRSIRLGLILQLDELPHLNESTRCHA